MSGHRSGRERGGHFPGQMSGMLAEAEVGETELRDLEALTEWTTWAVRRGKAAWMRPPSEQGHEWTGTWERRHFILNAMENYGEFGQESIRIHNPQCHITRHPQVKQS